MMMRPSRVWRETKKDVAAEVAAGTCEENWAEHLWPDAAVEAIDAVLADYEADVAALVADGALPGDTAVLAAAERAVTRINAVDHEHGMIETGERERLCEYIWAVPAGHGVDLTAMAARHGFDEGDLAGLWRDW
ncbi:hypothetical protein [Nocardiopsis sp. NRRL B-16309]|uniref:hypothetical protein n=1 Tax=Nocardiopsis sp. NRRL B-16309 TaxID=1519494 RepID=UPI0006C111FF|nr:hypothetical protein [Nocardiopsis sp. NRRL B-16309]KOX22264.1 hypothetical protein ADL05_03360 [Nocardiopsis sp. NRRL B-16309]